MGKYSGKMLTVYITPSGVRVIEGESRNGTPHLSRFFTVQGVSDYFLERPTHPGTYEIANMTALVDTIVNEFRNQRTSVRKVMVCSNCFGVVTEVREAGDTASIKDVLTGDISALKRIRKPKGEGPGAGCMECRVNWGELVQDGAVIRNVTVTTGDTYVLRSLVHEFYRCGYEVVSIADNLGTLVNLRQTEFATFDSQGKIIFDFDMQVNYMELSKDVPVGVHAEPMLSPFELVEHIEDFVQSSLDHVGRNPKIYLTGDLMRDCNLYGELIDKLEAAGYVVYDLFDRPAADPVTGLSVDTNKPVLTPDYTVNIAMLMSAYAKDVISLVPTLEFSEIFRKNSRAIAKVTMVLGIVCLLGTGALGVMRLMELNTIRGNPSSVASLQSQIESLTQNQQTLQSTIDTLTKADVTVLDLLNFAYNNQSSQVTLVSIDTQDMLVPGETPGGTVTSEDGTYESGYAGGGPKTREAIILRGFAKSGSAAVDYYDKLFHIGLPSDPILRGVQLYELPNGEQVFAFEIQVGGV